MIFYLTRNSANNELALCTLGPVCARNVKVIFERSRKRSGMVWFTLLPTDRWESMTMDAL